MARGLWLETTKGKARRHSWGVFVPLFLSLTTLVVGLYWSAPQEMHQPSLGERTRADLLNLLFSKEPPPADPRVDQFWLFVEEGKLDSQLRDTRDEDRPEDYIEGVFRWGDDRFTDCEVRLRGSMPWHHTPAKPSLRVKFPKKRNPFGFRYLELHRTEDPWGFINRAPEWIAFQEKIMSADSFPARLLLNRKDMGLYLAVLRPGAALALKNSRIPGTWFKGDVEAGTASLWTGVDAWRIFDESEAPQSKERFAEFLGLLEGAPLFTPNQRKRFSELVDEQQYALWDALSVLTGQVHTDDSHNQVFFYSSYAGKIEPVVWDSNSFGPLHPADGAINVLNNRVRHLALTDPRYVHKRNLQVYRMLEDYYSNGRLKAWMESEVERLREVTESETALGIIASRYPLDGPRAAEGDLFHRPLSVIDLDTTEKDLYDWIEERRAKLQRYLAQASVSVTPMSGGSLVAVYGEMAVEASLPDGQKILLYPGLAYSAEPEIGRRVTRPAPLYYQLPFAPDSFSFRNAVTGSPVQPGPPPAADSQQHMFSFHPWKLQQSPSPQEFRLGPGVVELNEDYVVEAGSVLIIEPGTTLRLGPGVSLLAEGLVQAMGTKEKPILIRPSTSEPFACVGVLGPGSRGSIFRYVDCEGGSVGDWRGVSFKGMFSVYGCPDLKLENCRFSRNETGDDSVNLGVGRAVVSSCLFEDARADALDMDQMTAQVRDCRFLRAGNDGLDLMSSRVTVVDSRFEGGGDKGVSVGEASQVEMEGCEFVDNEKGVEGKDKCQAKLVDCKFSGNQLALNLYRKKWLYPSGGQVFLSGCHFVDNARDVAVDGESTLWLSKTAAGAPYGPGKVYHRAPVGWSSL